VRQLSGDKPANPLGEVVRTLGYRFGGGRDGACCHPEDEQANEQKRCTADVTGHGNPPSNLVRFGQNAPQGRRQARGTKSFLPDREYRPDSLGLPFQMPIEKLEKHAVDPVVLSELSSFPSFIAGPQRSFIARPQRSTPRQRKRSYGHYHRFAVAPGNC
jgi:hypothetical protein